MARLAKDSWRTRPYLEEQPRSGLVEPTLDPPKLRRVQIEPKPFSPISRPIPSKMVSWVNSKGLLVKDLTSWRWLDSPTGEIIGLPGSRGRAMMTNGTLVLIERGDGSVFVGHYDWWKKDEPEKTLVQERRETRDRELRLQAARLLELLIT